MINLLEDVHKALDAKAFYLALMGALALPDICGSMEYPDGRAGSDRYAAWFDKWVGERYLGFLDGKQCYGFRCDMLHQGVTGQSHREYSRILFVLPGGTMVRMHRNIFNGALNLDLPVFCSDVTGGVHRWLEATSETEPIKSNLSRLMQIYPNGLAPYMVGVPIIG